MLSGASSLQNVGSDHGGETARLKHISAWLDRHKSPERILRVISRAVNCMEADPIEPAVESPRRNPIGGGPASTE